MSAAPSALPATLDVSGTPRVPFGRLVRVELRKMFDTRAGKWLIISMGILTALVLLIQVWVAAAQDLALEFTDFLTSMSIPMGILLPVLGVLSVTQEWSQRTGLITFVQEPRRARTIAAKLAGGFIIAAGAVLVALLLGIVGNVVFAAVTADPAAWDGTVGILLGFLALQVIGLGTGFAFGMLFRNTAAAIVIYFVYGFVIGGLFELGAALIDWFADLRPWIDFNKAQEPLINGTLTGAEWAHLVASGAVWFALPLAIGVWLLLRSEVK